MNRREKRKQEARDKKRQAAGQRATKRADDQGWEAVDEFTRTSRSLPDTDGAPIIPTAPMPKPTRVPEGMRLPTVAICTPVKSKSEPAVRDLYVTGLINLIIETSKHANVIRLSDDSFGYGHSRNVLTHYAIDKCSADYIFWLDSDTIVDPDCIAKLMQKDWPIGSALYWSKRGDPNPIAYTFKDGRSHHYEGEIPKKPFVVDAVGLGACLIKSVVYEALVQKVPDEIPEYGGVQFRYHGPDGRQACVFHHTVIRPTGVRCGEDIYFFELIKNYTKFNVHVDPSIVTRHLGDAEALWDGKTKMIVNRM